MHIHEQPGWPDFKWDMQALATPLASARHKQGLLLGQMSTLSLSLRAKAELESLTIEVLAAGTMQGHKLNRDLVRSALAYNLGITIDETLAVDVYTNGYVKLFLDVTKNCTLPLTAERIFTWHSLLFPEGKSGMHSIIVGALRSAKTGLKKVISGYSGHVAINYVPPGPENLLTNLEAFINWVNLPSDDPLAKDVVPRKYELDPVLEAGIASLWFMSIHPFETGNSLISQAIAGYIIAKSSNCHRHSSSLPAQVERDQKSYRDILSQSLKGDLDITAWLLWFLNCMQKTTKAALADFSKIMKKVQILEKASLQPINQRQKLVLHFVLENRLDAFTTRKYAKLAKCSPDTALRDIRDLIHFGIIKRNPKGGRNTSYSLLEGN